MKIKKGDQVKVITGKYKGTIGEVLQVFPKEDKVIVEGVNIAKKHLKPSQQNPDGGIVEKLLPIHVSNVMAYDSKKKVASRIGYAEEKGKKVRVYKKTGNTVK
ncbi:MAG: 50S ribosomal protein L24 [Erysipelotrichaceae bacterium]|jgi:large subunit ribosomal protein L24|nr:50S ribosomal protein L24 [Erysipelotrichaceae bacterium]MBR5796418.1 50S ribosomal protein L24 [Erysipelotrichaceae bacterium]